MASNKDLGAHDLRLGIPRLDRDHGALVGLVERFVQALSGAAARDVVQDLLLEILERTTEHFTHEQELMRASSYPLYEKHCAEHEELLAFVAQLLASHAEGRSFVTLKIALKLRPWLRHHVLGMDSQLARHLLRVQASDSKP